MRVAVMTAPGEVGVEDYAEPTIVKPTDAIIALSASCICGSDLWPYRGVDPLEGPRPMGHEYCGIVEEVGSAVTTVKPGQFVVGSFFASDNTCEICRSGYQPSCPHREAAAPGGAQAERMRVPLADGTLVATPELPSEDLVPHLLATSDVLGTGWFAAVAAEAGPGKTVAVVGDGAVGLLGVLAARQLGAERIIAMSRHEDRQKLALEFGATRHRHRTRPRWRRSDQGPHRRLRRALGDRGRRHPGVDDAGHPLHPRRRPHGLCRRHPRRVLERDGAVLHPRPPARRTGPGAALPARPDGPGLERPDPAGQGVRPRAAARRGG